MRGAQVTYGQAGVALTTTADPNVTAPSEDKVIAVPADKGGGVLADLAAWVAGTGGSATLQAWVYDPDFAAWFKLGATFVVTFGVMAYGSAQIPHEAKLYVQVTAVGAGAERVGLAIA